MREVKESDWKTYSKMVDGLRDRYLENQNLELAKVLASTEGSPTEKFWKVKEQADEQAKVLNACLGRHSRSTMFQNIYSMRGYGMLTDTDLESFSDELIQRVRVLEKEFCD